MPYTQLTSSAGSVTTYVSGKSTQVASICDRNARRFDPECWHHREQRDVREPEEIPPAVLPRVDWCNHGHEGGVRPFNPARNATHVRLKSSACLCVSNRQSTA